MNISQLKQECHTTEYIVHHSQPVKEGRLSTISNYTFDNNTLVLVWSYGMFFKWNAIYPRTKKISHPTF